MEKIADKIYDAYYSETDTIFRRKVRERIHWICSRAKGPEILDIGCSQGITSILLGREGKQVLGLDVAESSINQARANLEKEESDTQESVKFERGNLMLKEFSSSYNTVILGEVLEHISDIDSFFAKAASLLKEEGTLIVTTPFGINDFIDHKRTFYVNSFFDLQNADTYIEDIKFFGKWIGVVFKKVSNHNKEILPTSDILEEMENAFYQIERDLLESQTKWQKKARSLEVKVKSLEEAQAELEKQPPQQVVVNNEESEYKQLYLDEKVARAKVQKELLDEYKSKEELLNTQKKLLLNLERLQQRYSNLKNSTLGKVTVKYWRLRNKKRRK